MKYTPEFIPMSREEMNKLGWDELDILLISGDAYVDLPSFAAPLIGRLLLDQGWKVGLICQPDWKDPESITVMGRPRIGCGVTAGNMDSMLCLYTVGRRLRKDDMYAPGGEPGKRPPMASVVYTQMCKKAFPGCPVVMGGIEASMRRIAHYDYWQDKMRPGVLVDSKADILIYGMGERATVEIFRRLEKGESLEGIRGTVRFLGAKASAALNIDDSYVVLPDYDEMLADKRALMRETVILEREMNPHCGRKLLQKYNDRYLLVEPPMPPITPEEFDHVCELPFTGRQHPSYKETIPAYLTVRESIPAVRGCPGGCAFCGLVVHQGRHIISRTPESILRSVKKLAGEKFFHGTITDIGGAAGNIYGHTYKDPQMCAKCRRSSCMFPDPCKNYVADGKQLIDLLRKVRAVPGVKNVFINSGIRLDVALMQEDLTEEIIVHHVSGHMKVAPEHLHPRVLALMRKGKSDELEKFMKVFDRISKKHGKKQYLIPLFISNFPGCTAKEMKVVDDFLASHNWSPQQAQDYIPLPLTMGAAMYYCGETSDGTPIEVNRGLAERRTQLKMLKRDRTIRPKGVHGGPSFREMRGENNRKKKNFSKGGKKGF